ncbi:hypothetical protein [Gordonia sp. (in: high G+C Gram-positive bacteria)]|uniref:hypothetical protein n=1 Tax=Gordonia sp. (in: high G+C Gram-positive bacteria) TaxID=84139 RepID=UPI0039E51C05
MPDNLRHLARGAVVSVSRRMLMAVALVLLVAVILAFTTALGLKQTAVLCAVLTVMLTVTGSHVLVRLDVTLTLLSGTLILLASLPALLINKWLAIPFVCAVILFTTMAGVMGPRFGAWGNSTAMAMIYTAGTAASHRDATGKLTWDVQELLLSVVVATVLAALLAVVISFRKGDRALDDALDPPPDLGLVFMNGLVLGTIPARVVDPSARRGARITVGRRLRLHGAGAIVRGLVDMKSVELRQGIRLVVVLAAALTVILLHPGMPLTLAMLVTTLALLQPTRQRTRTAVIQRLTSALIGAGVVVVFSWAISGLEHSREISLAVGLVAMLIQVAYLGHPLITVGFSILATSSIPMLGWHGTPVRYALVYLAALGVIALFALLLEVLTPDPSATDEEILASLRDLVDTTPRSMPWRRAWAHAAAVESTLSSGPHAQTGLAQIMHTARMATIFSVEPDDQWAAMAQDAYDQAAAIIAVDRP